MVVAAAVAGGTALASTGGSILSGMGAQREATKARRSQETAATQQLEWNRHMWSQEQVDRAPWLRAGTDALTNLQSQAEGARDRPNQWDVRQGVNPAGYAWQPTPTVSPMGYQRPGTIDPSQYRFEPGPYQFGGPQAVDPSQYRFDASRYGYTPTQALDPNQYRYTPTDTAPLGQFNFKPPTVTDDPGYAFRLRSGQEAIDASAAARGGLGSGAQQKALARYGQDLGSQEYQAAYGRSWQQQQEAYERSRLMNMTQEERQRYADEANYGRAQTANLTTEERQRYADATRYGRDFAANQFNLNAMTQGQQVAWQQAQAENQMRYERDLAANERLYGREVQRQGLDYSQGLAADDLNYRRLVEENALRESRGLTANQLGYGRDVAYNETMQARDWQEYAAYIAEQERNWNQWAQLAGFGIGQQNQLGQLGASYAQGIGNAYGAMGNAQATGYLNQANAQTNMYSGIAGSLAQGGQNYMMYNYMQGLNNRQPTSGTLPTTQAAYNAGNYANTTYAPFGTAPSAQQMAAYNMPLNYTGLQ